MRCFPYVCPPKDSKRKESSACELAYTIGKFEKQYETTLEFKKADENSKTPGKLFATSRFNGRNIYIVISKNCQEAIGKVLEGTDAEAAESIRKEFFMVMKRHKNGKPYWVIMKSSPKIAAACKDAVSLGSIDDLMEVAKASEAETRTDTKAQENTDTPAENRSTTESQSIGAVLKQFLDSNCDLSILEQWDKTRNS